MLLPWRDVRSRFGDLIPTSLTSREITYLRSLAEGRRVLEIGSAYGYSTIEMSEFAKDVVSVDFHQHIPDSWERMSKMLVKREVKNVAIVVARSSDILPSFGSHSFDMAFIDGDHTYDGVLADAMDCLRIIKPGGILAFHDCGEDTCPDVEKALADFELGCPVTPIDHVDTLKVYRIFKETA